MKKGKHERKENQQRGNGLPIAITKSKKTY